MPDISNYFPGPGERVERFPEVGCIFLGVFRTVLLAIEVLNGPGQQVPWEP